MNEWNDNDVADCLCRSRWFIKTFALICLMREGVLLIFSTAKVRGLGTELIKPLKILIHYQEVIKNHINHLIKIKKTTNQPE